MTRINPDLETKSIRVLCNANTTEGYVPWKDASLPEINLVGGNIPAQLGGPSAQDRQHLAFFAGHDHGPVRPHLFKHWEGKDDDVRVYQSLPPQLNYHDLMKRSRYFSIPRVPLVQYTHETLSAGAMGVMCIFIHMWDIFSYLMIFFKKCTQFILKVIFPNTDLVKHDPLFPRIRFAENLSEG